jgi:uncharacterized membrane protein YdjX (TVP38/TMEM64 family)
MEGKSRSKVRWIKLGLTIAAFIVVSVGLGYLTQSLLAHYHIPLDFPIWIALLILLGIMIAVNLSVLPLPFGISLMLVASSHWNPFLVALVGSLGASIGEFSSYFFGYLGKKVSIDENMIGYKLIHSWIMKHGFWTIAVLSFQPILPFEIGGFIAGLAKMPIHKFFPAIWVGKFPKYLLLIFLGNAILHVLHLPEIK